MSAVNRRRRIVGAVTVVAAATLAPLLLGPGTSSASSHREAPLIAGLPQLDNTDVYAFRSPGNDGTVTLISNWIPFQAPNGGPNFYPFSNNAKYDINIDNNGDAKPDITYQWTFASHYVNPNTFLYNTGVVHHLTDSTLNFRQVYNLTRITWTAAGKVASSTVLGKNLPVAPSDTGLASMPNYATLRNESIKTIGSRKTFAGQADDPFFLDLRVFDLLYGGNTGGKGFTEFGNDSLKNYNVNTVALKVPLADLALKGNPTRNPVVGIWSTTLSKSSDGSYAQVSRLGNPLVNEVVVPVALKDAFNSLPPVKDHTIPAVVNKVKVPEVPQLIQSIYGIPAPTTPRNDLVEVFLTGVSKNSGGPIKADLNSQLLNKDVNPEAFVPSEELRLNLDGSLGRQAEQAGRAGRRRPGLPERSPADRRCRRHRTAGARRCAAAVRQERLCHR